MSLQAGFLALHFSLLQANQDALRDSRKDQVMQVACRVQAEYEFRLATRDAAIEENREE